MEFKHKPYNQMMIAKTKPVLYRRHEKPHIFAKE